MCVQAEKLCGPTDSDEIIVKTGIVDRHKIEDIITNARSTNCQSLLLDLRTGQSAFGIDYALRLARRFGSICSLRLALLLNPDDAETRVGAAQLWATGVAVMIAHDELEAISWLKGEIR